MTVLVPSLQADLKAVFRKWRQLPVAGKILSQLGEDVQADSIIAYAEVAGELLILHPAESLALDPEEVQRGLKVKQGDSVNVGDLLVEVKGLFNLFSSRFYAPTAGVIEFISEKTANIGIRLASKRVELNAYISGKVIEVESNKNILIETEAAVIQGIFGIGGERIGKLKLLNLDSNSKLTKEHIPDNANGLILVGGMSPDEEVLQKVISSGAVGLITGSIDDIVLENYLGRKLGVAITGNEEIPCTFIITEGFGDLPISEKVLSLLKKLDGLEASINGATQVRAGAMRPEIIVSHNFESDNLDPDLNLIVGARVRLIRYPYFGQFAVIKALPSELQLLATGAHARIAVVSLADGKEAIIPRANLELA